MDNDDANLIMVFFFIMFNVVVFLRGTEMWPEKLQELIIARIPGKK